MSEIMPGSTLRKPKEEVLSDHEEDLEERPEFEPKQSPESMDAPADEEQSIEDQKVGLAAAREALTGAFGNEDGKLESAEKLDTEPEPETAEQAPDKYQQMIDAARGQFDQDRGFDSQSEIKDQVSSKEMATHLENLPTAEIDLNNVELPPEAAETIGELEDQFTQEVEQIVVETGSEKSEKPIRELFTKSMIVLTAAAALWMFQATTAPDTAHAGKKQDRVGDFGKKQKKKVETGIDKIKKIPGKIGKELGEDVADAVSDAINDAVDGIFGKIFKK